VDRVEAKIDRLLSFQPSEFDRIYQRAQILKAARQVDPQKAFDALKEVVRGLDVGGADSSPDVGFAGSGPEPEPQRFRPPNPQPRVVLPQRRTHGGPYGPAVRAKLTREALGG
jgi:hypothetical protein